MADTGGHGPCGGWMDSWGRYVSKNLYVKTKKLEPLGGAWAGHAPSRSANEIHQEIQIKNRKKKIIDKTKTQHRNKNAKFESQTLQCTWVNMNHKWTKKINFLGICHHMGSSCFFSLMDIPWKSVWY